METVSMLTTPSPTASPSPMPSELSTGGSGSGAADPAAEDSVPAWVVGVVLVPILFFACVAIIYFKCAQDYFRRRNDPGASFDEETPSEEPSSISGPAVELR